MHNKTSQQIISAALIGSVMLGGLHSKDLVNLSNDTADAKNHVADVQVKIINDLHNHIDKQGLSMLKVSSGDSGAQHIDGRGMRLLHSHKLITPHDVKAELFAERMFGLMLITAKV